MRSHEWWEVAWGGLPPVFVALSVLSGLYIVRLAFHSGMLFYLCQCQGVREGCYVYFSVAKKDKMK